MLSLSDVLAVLSLDHAYRSWTPPLIFFAAAFAAVLYRDITATRRAGKWALAQRLADEGSFNIFVIVCSLIPNIALFIRKRPTRDLT